MASLEAPYFRIPTDGNALQLQIPRSHHSTEHDAQHVPIADAILESSRKWILERISGLQNPGLQLDLGLDRDVNLLREHKLHLYALALADEVKVLTGIQFACLRITKRYAETTVLSVAEAAPSRRPPHVATASLTTRRSYATPAFVSEVQDATQNIRDTIGPNKPIRLGVRYVTGLPRTWARLWEPTLAGLFPRTSETESRAAQIVNLALDHRSVGEQLGHRVQMTISTEK